MLEAELAIDMVGVQYVSTHKIFRINTMPTEDEMAASSLYGFNPLTRRYVLRSGLTWKKLVKQGVVQDASPEPAARADNVAVPEEEPEEPPSELEAPRKPTRAELVRIALAHRDELLVNGLTRAEALAMMRRWASDSGNVLNRLPDVET